LRISSIGPGCDKDGGPGRRSGGRGFVPAIGCGVEPAFDRAAVHWSFASLDDNTGFFELKYGPVVMAKAALEPDGRWEALRRDIRASYAERINADGSLSYPGEYLVSTGTKAG
jgi:hypothetical protein